MIMWKAELIQQFNTTRIIRPHLPYSQSPCLSFGPFSEPNQFTNIREIDFFIAPCVELVHTRIKGLQGCLRTHPWAQQALGLASAVSFSFTFSQQQHILPKKKCYFKVLQPNKDHCSQCTNPTTPGHGNETRHIRVISLVGFFACPSPCPLSLTTQPCPIP